MMYTKMRKMYIFVSYKCTKEHCMSICMSFCTTDPATRGRARPKKQRDKGSSWGDAHTPEPLARGPAHGADVVPERGAQVLGREEERPAAHHPGKAFRRPWGIGLWAFT